MNTPEHILTQVCQTFHVSPYDLLGRNRKQPASLARQVAMALTHKYTELSRADTAVLFRRDYTTVLWAENIVWNTTHDNNTTQKIQYLTTTYDRTTKESQSTQSDTQANHNSPDRYERI